MYTKDIPQHIYTPLQGRSRHTIYPTEWQLGKARGSIKELDNGFLARITPNDKTLSKYFFFKNYKNIQDTLFQCKQWLKNISDEYDLTRNQLRYINQNTIEVKLTNEQTMITDAEYINKVELYPLQAKPKKEKDGTKYYVMYQDKKKVARFVDLIGNFNILQFKNGNTLDLRKENLKEFGSVEKEIKIDNISDYVFDNQHKYFNLPINELPKNIWLLGKPSGTIFKRTDKENIICVRVSDNENNQHTKTFNINDYKNVTEAEIEAKKWQIDTSYKLGVTKNLIRIVNNEDLEIMITKNNICKTNVKFIPLIQKIPIFTAISGNGINYVECVVNRKNVKFHSLITGFNMTDHINGDTLDNRLDNLRPATVSMNNSNRHVDISHFDISDTTIGMQGVKIVNTIFGKAYKASIKLEGTEYSKYYSVNKFTEKGAKEEAQKFRKKLAKCTNLHEDITIDDDIKLIKYLLIKLQHIIEHTKKSIVYDHTEYLKKVDMPENIKKDIHKYYLYKFLNFNNNNEHSQTILQNLVLKKILL